MRPLIPRSAYFEDEAFRMERQSLFGRLWQFAGFATDLAAPNDFITTEVAGRAVLVQNFDGELRGFANVCSHRFSRLRCEAKGNGKLRCGYHGWIYNAEGIPYSIPSRPRFDALKDRAEVARLALRRYDLDVCGGLVFVREGAEGEGDSSVPGESLREFLGASFAPLEQMSLALGTPVSRLDVLLRCNWKVAVENGLEAYHVGFVHEETFKPLEMSGMDFRFDGLHSSWHAPVEASTASRLGRLVKASRMPHPVPGYVHQLIFPNVTVSTLCGATFGFQVLRPVSPVETQLTSIVFLSRMKADAGVQEMVHSALTESTAVFTEKVTHEDRVVCEAVQLGLRDATQPGILSEEEERVHRFHAAYMEQMSTSAASHPLTHA
ncbi:MAG: aromatic ring-hydroxylating dioxygenase subunit alpha [Gemmatimonadaceae bacterium]|nr:aromatic ring-hydroxylating dioxygenase subunit alpha [Gemmatimonadaceae bacterium]